MTFHDWYDDNLHRLIKGNLHDALQEAWQVAQQVERVRYRKLLEAAMMFIDAFDHDVKADDDMHDAYKATHAAIRGIQDAATNGETNDG